MRVPVDALKEFVERRNLSQASYLLISHIMEDCSQATDFGDRLRDVLNCSEFLHLQPSTVKRLQRRAVGLEEILRNASK